MVSTSFVGIDTENDGHIDGYDIDGDGVIDAKSNLGHASTTATQIDLDGDGIIDSNVGIDLNGDGIVDGFNTNGDGYVDVKATGALAVASQTEMFDNQKKLIVKSNNQNLNKIDDYDTEPSYSKSNLSDRDSQRTEYSDNDHKSPY